MRGSYRSAVLLFGAGLALGLLLLAPFFTAGAQITVCYLVADGSNDFRTFNLSTNTETLVGATGVADIEALAVNPTTAAIFAHNGTGSAAARFGGINTATGAFTAIGAGVGTGSGSVGAVAFDDLDGLTFDPLTGILYAAHRRGAAGEADLLLRVDPTTGAFVANAFGATVDYVVVPAPTGFPTLTDLDDIAIDPTDGQMYGIANSGGVGDRLVQINKATGAVTDVGALGASDMEGLTFNDLGQLFGTTGGSSSPATNNNSLWTINKTTAATSLVSALGSTDYEAVGCQAPAIPTPTATNTPTDTPAGTPTSTNTPTPTDTPTDTPTPTNTPLDTPTPTNTPIDTPTSTPTGVPSIVDPNLEIPETGFALGRVTRLPLRPEAGVYLTYGDLWLEIPRLRLKTTIVGVPQSGGSWDVTWLWDQAGYLHGTAFPTLEGNSVITAHVSLPTGKAGPFADLETLRFGDLVVIHAWGLRHMYEIRDMDLVTPDNPSVFRHEEQSWLTLVTCQGYDEAANTYRWRLAVRAVLVAIEDEDSPGAADRSISGSNLQRVYSRGWQQHR